MAESLDSLSEHGVNQKRRNNTLSDAQLDNKFKKARYSWQIKGKSSNYATDDDGNEHMQISPSPSEEIVWRSTNHSSSFHEGEEEIEKHIADDSITNNNKDVHTMDSSPVRIALPSHEVDVNETSIDNNAIHIKQRDFRSKETKRDCVDRNHLDITPRKRDCIDRNNPDISSRRIPSLFGNFNQIRRNTQNSQGINTNFDQTSFSNHHPLNIASCMWQKEEVGCAIVDNVFNRTLEELGLSPDPQVNLQATTRLSVENSSIEAAINNQGLRVNAGDESVEDENTDEKCVDFKSTTRPNDVLPKQYERRKLNSNTTRTDMSFHNMLQGIVRNRQERKQQSCSTKEIHSYPQINEKNVNIQIEKSECDRELEIESDVKVSVLSPAFISNYKETHSLNHVITRDESKFGDLGKSDMGRNDSANETVQLNPFLAHNVPKMNNLDNACTEMVVRGTVNCDPFVESSGELDNCDAEKRDTNYTVVDSYSDSENVLDLAVSAAILSQGLVVKESS